MKRIIETLPQIFIGRTNIEELRIASTDLFKFEGYLSTEEERIEAVRIIKEELSSIELAEEI